MKDFSMHNLQIELRKLAKPEKIPIYKNFFKTGKGEYGEGDEFIGVTVPDSRKVAKANVDISGMHPVLTGGLDKL